ncbi:MAG: tripartite tricarboxylate transporter TctB family protein, partial [Pseudomonadota bacterium]
EEGQPQRPAQMAHLRTLGFILSTSLFLIAGFMLLGERRPLWLLAASVPLVVAFWALMDRVLGVYVAALPAFLGF